MNKPKHPAPKFVNYEHTNIFSCPDLDDKFFHSSLEETHVPSFVVEVPFDIAQELETLSPVRPLPSK